MFYECQNGEQELTRELFKRLGKNLRRHIPYYHESSDDDADATKLKEFIAGYARQEFKKEFHFNYLGAESSPPKKKVGHRVEAYEKLFEITSHPVEEKEVKDWVDTEVFRFVDTLPPRLYRNPANGRVCLW